MEFAKISKNIKKAIEARPSDFAAYEDLLSLCREYKAESADKKHLDKCHDTNIYLREKAALEMRNAAQIGDFDLAERLDNLIFKSLVFCGSDYFDDYMQAVEYTKPLNKKFYLPRRHYLKRYVDAYQDILDGNLDFLSVSMPKRAIMNTCPVVTKRGIVKHGELKVGDYVLGENYEWVRVEKVWPKERMYVLLRFTNGFEVECSYGHEWKLMCCGDTFEMTAYCLYHLIKKRYSFYLPVKDDSEEKIYVAYIEFLNRRSKKYHVGNCITVEGGYYRIGLEKVLTHNCGKSQMGINFVTMLSGREPNKSTLMEGTGDDLVNSFYKGCLEYIQKPNDYHFYDIFPYAKLVQTSADTKTFNIDTKSRFPTVMCRSIDARQVGLSEATSLLYLDDCVEGREEAKNRKRLDEKWEIISGDIIGRAIEGTPIVICGTRYSLYDPIGRLQEEMSKQSKRMRIIEIPALDAVTDKSNFEYVRDGKKVFTTKYFRDQREMLSAEQFESEFQQQPFEAKGLLFPEKSLNRYYELPVEEPDSVVAVCDTAEKGSDYTAMVVLKIYGDDIYVDDVVFDDSTPEITKPQCAKKIVDNGVVSAIFESNNAGEYYSRDVNKLVEQMGHRVSICTKRTISNKQTRIEFASDGIIAHFFFKDVSKYDRNSQYAAFIKQLITYTRSGKVEHDDAPDVLSLAENNLRKIFVDKPEVFVRPF